MKKIVTLLFILSLSLSNDISFSQSGWFWLNPTPTGNNINAAEFTGNDTIICVGDAGMILKSNNSGVNWYPVFTTASNLNSVMDIRRVGNGSLLVVGGVSGNGYIQNSTNSGANWYSTYNSNSKLYRFFNLDSNIVFAVGDDRVLKSYYGGSSWSDISPPSGAHYFRGVNFINSQTGFVVGYNTIYISGWPPSSYTRSLIVKTTNNGSTWTLDSLGNGFKLNDIYFITSSKGYMISSNGRFYKTSNSGVNWQFQAISNLELTRLYVIDTNNILVVGSNLYKTTNAGVNWVYSGVSSTNIAFSKSKQKGVLVGPKGSLFISTDYGISWNNLRRGFFNTYDWEFFQRVHFADKNHGIAITSNGMSQAYKTSNGGLNWILMIMSASGPCYSPYLVDSSTGFIVGVGGVIYKTTNFGVNWVIKFYDPDDLEGITFVNYNTGFAVGDYGSICKTTNCGENWSYQYYNYDYYFKDVSFINPITGVVVGMAQGGAIYWTTNCGDTWMTRNSGLNTYTSFNGVSMINDSTAIIADRDRRILKSTNSGINWRIVYNSTSTLNDVSFKDAQNGIVVGNGGVILKTSNSGENWALQQSNSLDNLNGCASMGPSDYVAVGGNYCILTTRDLSIIGISKTSSNFPSSPSLSQNYPNPFNPISNIKYQIAKLSNVKLVIFDVLGREIETLVNESQKPGSYEITWDGSRYASGVYFYKLMTEEWTETKKMVLIK